MTWFAVFVSLYLFVTCSFQVLLHHLAREEVGSANTFEEAYEQFVTILGFSILWPCTSLYVCVKRAKKRL